MTTLGVMGVTTSAERLMRGGVGSFMKPPAPRRPGYNHIDFGRVKRLYFRGDAAFANPEVYEFFEAEGMSYTIRLPANRVLQDKIGHLLKRPVGRPPQEMRRYYSSFSYQASSWNKPRRVVAKVEWHPGELYPRVGFIVTNLARPAERLVAFYNHRGRRSQLYTMTRCRRYIQR